MKYVFLLAAITITIATSSQVTRVSLQASGLTCSMCSNAINKALRTLEFVDNVDADIKHYTFEISFKTGFLVDFDKIKNKVESAGFSVSGFIATIYFNKVRIRNDQPVQIAGNTLCFSNLKDQELDGVIRVTLLDKGYISSKEDKNKSFSTSAAGSGIYHVSI